MKKDWKPIHTAPKDGRKLLLAAGDEVFIGFYMEDDPENGYWCDENGYEEAPEWWMPLPEAPEETKG
jgi:hypothetical protein